MSFRKYAGDYRLENVPGRNGKLRTETVYRGAYYRFECNAEALAAARPKLLGGGLLFGLSQIFSLALNTRCARCAWVIFPQALAILAGGFLVAGLWMLLRAPERMTREYAEKVQNRIKGGAFMAMLLSGITFIGSIVAAIIYRAELLTADIFYILLLLASAFGAVYCFINRRYAATREE